MGNISPLEAFLCGVLYWIGVGNFPFIGLWTLQRPLICGTITGVILGHPLEGVMIGASINLIYMGFMSAGGSMPADMSLAGILGTVYAISGGLDVKTAIAIAVPIGLLGSIIWTTRMTVDSIFVHMADRYIEREEYHKIWRANVCYPQIFCACISILPCAIAAYFGAEYITGCISLLDGKILQILQTAGGLMPCLGIAITLRYIFEGEAKVFFFVGFFIVAYTNLPMHIIGVISLLVAILYVKCKGEEAFMEVDEDWEDEEEEEEEEPPHRGKLLSKSSLIKAWMIWEHFPQTCYNYERMMGQQMAHIFVSISKKLYPNDREKRKDLMKREIQFFNTHVEFGACVTGMTIALEEKKAMGEMIPDSLIQSLKTSFMGSVAGIGDTIWQGAVLPVILALCIDFTKSGNGNLLGPVLYAGVIFVLAYVISYHSFFFGYRMGGNGILDLLEKGAIKKVIFGSSIMGCMMMGGIVVKYVACSCNIRLHLVSGAYSLQGQLFDKICPQILPLAVTMLVYYLLKRRKWSTTKVMLAILFVSIIGSLTGILV